MRSSCSTVTRHSASSRVRTRPAAVAEAGAAAMSVRCRERERATTDAASQFHAAWCTVSLSASSPSAMRMPISVLSSDLVIDHPSSGVWRSMPSSYCSATTLPACATTMARVWQLAGICERSNSRATTRRTASRSSRSRSGTSSSFVSHSESSTPSHAAASSSRSTPLSDHVRLNESGTRLALVSSEHPRCAPWCMASACSTPPNMPTRTRCVVRSIDTDTNGSSGDTPSSHSHRCSSDRPDTKTPEHTVLAA